MNTIRDALRDRILTLIEHAPWDGTADEARDALLADLLRFQAEHVPVYGALAASRPGELPALPTGVFGYARVAAHPAALDVATFLSSGTGGLARSAHVFRDLSLYEAAARRAASACLFEAGRPYRFIVVGYDPEHDDPAHFMNSSLFFMLERFAGWFARDSSWHGTDLFGSFRDAKAQRLRARLRDVGGQGDPVALLGTSLAFSFAEEALGDEGFALPSGSVLMHTGGFKGRTREVEPRDFQALLRRRYGVTDAQIISEYGMTELSSQFYEDPKAPVDAATGRRPYLAPPWVRVRAANPDTLEPLPEGTEGLLRIDDAANLDSCAAIQTSDVGRVVGRHVFLRGRAAGAELRGCSLAAEDAILGMPKPESSQGGGSP